MLKIYAAVLIFSLLMLSGCQNLMHKSFATGGKVEAFKVVLGVDPESGSFLPFPQQVILGFGSHWLIDMPMTENSEAIYYNEEPLRFSDSVSKTFVYMKSGGGVIKGHIKVQIDSKAIIDLPIFKVYNPFSDGKDITVDGDRIE